MRPKLTLFRMVLQILLLALPPAALCDTLQLEISGLKNDTLATNIRAHVGSDWVPGSVMRSERKRERFRKRAETDAAKALRPYGYYFPEISGRISPSGERNWILKLDIDVGRPVMVRRLSVAIKGHGHAEAEIAEWRANWPLVEGTRLNQTRWDEEKQALLDVAAELGYLAAVFEKSSIELDLEQNVADLELVFDTGPRAVMGEITYHQDVLRAGVLESLPRFEPGEHYSAWLVEKLRTDLWKTGYFSDIAVVEQARMDAEPPRVDLEVTLRKRNKRTHQGTLGYGTDSQFRLQYRMQQHLLSSRGDSLGVGIGWQQRNEELLLSAEYRIPRRTRSNQYWLINPALKTEAEDLYLGLVDSRASERLLSVRVKDALLRLGKAKYRNIRRSQEQLIETMYVQLLQENADHTVAPLEPGPLPLLAETYLGNEIVTETNNSIALGMDWDWPVIEGKNFNTRGHHERAWLLGASKAWGSEREFLQAYVSSRWNFVLSDHWKVLLRGEVGYTDAEVIEVTEADDKDDVLLSITDLPYLYRFKAGGSRSVRGYGFEELSTNNVGSNHLITASAELEYQFREDWSAAAFIDTGNAFNDWSNVSLKTGIGLGLRWYTIAGVIRVDVAQAQDIEGKPWQLHLSIGTPLL